MWSALAAVVFTLAVIWAFAYSGAYAICLANHNQDYCYQELQ